MLEVNTDSTGFGSPARDWAKPRLDLNKIIQPEPTNVFYFRYKGFGFQDVQEGDVLVVDVKRVPTSSDIVVVEKEDGFVLSKWNSDLEHPVRGCISWIIKKK